MKTSSKHLSTVLALALAVFMWGYCAHGRQLTEQRLTVSGFPERNFSDLFPRWLGTRELLLHGHDPYSVEITREIQRGYYGRPIDSARATDPIDEQRFAYPLFVVFLLAPTIALPFNAVKAAFTVILLAAAIWTVLLWIRVIGLKPGHDKTLTYILLTLATIPYAQGIQFQQLSVLVVFFVAVGVYALANKQFIVAGLSLALATIKPQLSVYLIACVLLWSAWRWGLRKSIAISFCAVLVVFIAASELLLPGWPSEFFAGIQPYLHYTQATTGIHELFGRVGETIVLALLAIVTALAVWRARSKPVDSDEFKLAISLALAFTCISIPSLAPHNQVLLVPGYLLLVKEGDWIRSGGRLARSLWWGAWLTLIWPWVAGTLLVATFVFDRASSRLWDLPLATNPLIPITLFGALAPLLIRRMGRRDHAVERSR
ncbi:MAG: glycosyltransferase family 87 protein [Terriglobales bacterium]